MRVFALSDVHADFRENLKLIASISKRAHCEDALILAGDVSHDLGRLREALQLFLERFQHVFFVPGNHELWIRKREHETSVQKFCDVLRLCDAMGIHTSPKYIGTGSGRVCIVPLFSWYTRPEEGGDTLFRDRPIEEPTAAVWSDDYLVKWPETPRFKPSVFFSDINHARVNTVYDAPVLTVSHFLPRADLMFAADGEEMRGAPDATQRMFNFSRVAGSTLIEAQLRRLGSRVHVYGHQHRNRCRHYDGIWYISNCLGYAEERDDRRVQGVPEVVRSVWPLEESGLSEPVLSRPSVVKQEKYAETVD
jgi:predicted phosphodiesterase